MVNCEHTPSDKDWVLVGNYAQVTLQHLPERSQVALLLRWAENKVYEISVWAFMIARDLVTFHQVFPCLSVFLVFVV